MPCKCEKQFRTARNSGRRHARADSALYFDKKPDVDRYLLAMERLSVVSAKPSETPGILTTIINRLEDEPNEHPQPNARR